MQDLLVLCQRLPHDDLRKEGQGRTGRDVITYGAPALLLFHAHRGAECHTENIFIALVFGLLAAHAMGLGATAMGLVPPAVDRDRDLRKLFAAPEGNEVLASMIVGHPKSPRHTQGPQERHLDLGPGASPPEKKLSH